MAANQLLSTTDPSRQSQSILPGNKFNPGVTRNVILGEKLIRKITGFGLDQKLSRGSMKKQPARKGKLPEELYLVSTEDEFRTYVYIKQALRWLDSQLKQGKSPRLITYSKQEEHEV